MEFEQMALFEKSEMETRKEFVANVFRQLGSTNHSDTERQKEDFYATEPLATVLLCEKEKFSPTVWEPCVGMGHIAEVLKQQGYEVVCSDIVDRGYPKTQIMDFLRAENIGGGREPKRHYYEPTLQTCNTICQKGNGYIRKRRKGCNVLENTVFGIARALGTV